MIVVQGINKNKAKRKFKRLLHYQKQNQIILILK